MLKSPQISLRLLEDNDLEFLYSVENNADNKKYGANNGYLSKNTLEAYIKNSGVDIRVYGQQRFVIVLNNTSCHYKLKLLVLIGTKFSPTTFDLQKK